MPKDILDVLSDKEKVKEITSLPTVKDVENTFKREGVNITSEDIKILGNIFKEAYQNRSKNVDEKKLASVGGGLSLKKAVIAAGVIAAVTTDMCVNEGKVVKGASGYFTAGVNVVNNGVTWFNDFVQRL